MQRVKQGDASFIVKKIKKIKFKIFVKFFWRNSNMKPTVSLLLNWWLLVQTRFLHNSGSYSLFRCLFTCFILLLVYLFYITNCENILLFGISTTFRDEKAVIALCKPTVGTLLRGWPYSETHIRRNKVCNR